MVSVDNTKVEAFRNLFHHVAHCINIERLVGLQYAGFFRKKISDLDYVLQTEESSFAQGEFQ